MTQEVGSHGERIEYDVRFEDGAEFLKEFETNIRHGGMFLQWDNPPPKDTKVKIIVHPPYNLNPVEMDAVVVFPSPAGVGLELTGFNKERKALLEGYVSTCKVLVEAFKQVKAASPGAEAPAGAAPPPATQANGGVAVLPEAPPSLPAGTALHENFPASQVSRTADAHAANATASGGAPLAMTPSVGAAIAPPVVSVPLETMPAAPASAISRPPPPQPVSPPYPSEAPRTTNADAAAKVIAAPPLEGGAGAFVAPAGYPQGPAGTPPGYAPPFGPPPAGYPQGPAPYAYPPSHQQDLSGDGTDPHAAQQQRPNLETPSWTGSLSDTPLANVLIKLFERSASGMLVVKGPEATARFYYRGGNIVRTVREPPNPNLLFGQLLVGSSQVSKLELDAALKDAEQSKLPIGQALVKRHAIPASSVGKILKEQQQESILEQVKVEKGTFAFHDRVRPPKGPPLPPTNPLRVIFRGKVDEYRMRLQAQMDKVEAPYLNLYLFPSASVPEDMSVIGLSDNEIRFWNLVVTGGYNLRDVYNVSPLSRRATHGLVIAMVEMGFAEFQNEMKPELRAKMMQKLLRRKEAQMGKANAFGVLEIHWISHEREIKEAYETKKKEYDCSKISHLLSESLNGVSKEILRRLDEAYKELSTHDGRQRVRRESLEPSQIQFHADLLMQQGEMAVFKNDRREAEDRFLHVLEITPGNRDAQQKLHQIQALPAGS